MRVPLLVAASLAATAVVITVGTRSDHPPGAHSAPDGGRAEAIEWVTAALDHAQVPPGATAERPSIRAQGFDLTVTGKRTWTAPGTVAQATASLRAQPPAGLVLTDEQTPGARAYGAPPDRHVVKVEGPAATLWYGRYGGGDYAPGLSYSVRPAPAGVIIEAKAYSYWKPYRPAWSIAGGSVTTVDVTVTRPSVPAFAVGGAPTVRRTLTGAPANLLVGLVNSLPAKRPIVSLGCSTSAPDSLAIRTSQSTLEVSTDAACPSRTGIGEPGRQRFVYVRDEQLNSAVLQALGLPRNYGLARQ
jgi:hypothetical protein